MRLKSNRLLQYALLLVAAAALALRVPHLDRRPLHNDEAVNAVKLQSLWEKGAYIYDPNEFHGPALYYAALPFLWLTSDRDFDRVTETTLRLAPVCYGVALILLLWLIGEALGRAATLWAGLLTALSPAMVFYSRYFIHEMMLVCFTLVVLAAAWRYTRTRHPGWAVLGGAGLGLMYATKETFVIAVGAMGLAALLTAAWNRWRDQKAWTVKSYWSFQHALAALLAAAAVSIVLFTSFFTNPSGPLDSVRSYLPWLSRAGGNSPHIHPWHFYLERLAYFHPGKGPIWSEGLILILAGVGVTAALVRKGLADANVTCVRFVGFYTLIMTGAYSAISYKTPWCLLGFLHGMILLAGVGAAVLVRMCAPRTLRVGVIAVLMAAAGQLAWQAWRGSYLYFADGRNPYVYAQTVPDILQLVQKVEGLSKVHPQGHQMLLQVMAPENEYWPLPWYLRRFKRVGWWDRVPADPYAPAMIVGSEFRAALDDKSNKAWLMVGLFELRPQVFFELYVQFDLWRQYVERLPRERE
ncbi:MAG: TIGR03663 family protein [Chloroflexi bacterium]|nr:TIGR03663 family protein [Chloroflexota bacterium]